MASIGFFDIETTGLQPNRHRFLTCAVARNLEQTPWLVVNMDDSEAAALVTTHAWLTDLDKVVSWGGNYFDLPFLNYRLARNDLPRLNIKDTHFDLKAWCKKNDPYGLMASKDRFFHGMEAHAIYAGIEAKATPFDEELWQRATDGDVEALTKVASHNVEDVITLRSLYDRLIEPVDERKRQLPLF